MKHEDPFEAGQEDIFKKVLSKGLGVIYKVKIRSDNAGVFPGWFLNKVAIVDELAEKRYVFTCNDWLYKDSTTNRLTREMECKGFPIVGVDTLMKKNGPIHHVPTNKGFTLRRGESFRLIILLARNYTTTDVFYFTLNSGEHPNYRDKSLVTIKEVTPTEYLKCKKKEKWGFVIRDVTQVKQIEIEVYIPGTASVLSHVMMIETEHATEYVFKHEFCILPNPWKQDASTFQNFERSIKSYFSNTSSYIDKKVSSCCNCSGKSTPKTQDFKITEVDLMIPANKSMHYTAKFKNTSLLILRRGQSFKIKIRLSRNYNTIDEFYLTLKTGPKPRDVDGTFVTILQKNQEVFYECKTKKEWAFTILDVSNPREVIVGVFIPPNVVVGLYDFAIENQDKKLYASQICILFNPWCREDDVYMEDKEAVREYVLRQHGILFLGKYTNPAPKNWFYGQFEDVSLQVAMQLLNEIMPAANRSSAVHVSRYVSSKVNSYDNGIVVGNWSNNYEGGKSPGFWSNTCDILKVYVESKQSVRYGQCWVYGAVVTTILRTLGIPCRPVTNYNSAHDTDGNCTLDQYIDELGMEIEDLTRDSIWNFHVWNDAWMARKDLPPGYDGWQAIDATPQEKSGGKFRLGPAPVKAVKKGEVNIGYDTKFVFAEVNSDVIQWKKTNGKFEAISSDTEEVGKNMSTKAVGCNERFDVTDEYKFKEGSALERVSVTNAVSRSRHREISARKSDCEMSIVIPNDHIEIGEDACVEFTTRNNSVNEAKAKLTIVVEVITYGGKVVSQVKTDRKNLFIGANTGNRITQIIKAAEYRSKLGDYDMLKITGALLLETGQTIFKQDICIIKKPTLQLKIPTHVVVKKEMEFMVRFQNPLDEELTGCVLHISGTIISKGMTFQVNNTQPKSWFACKNSLSLVPEFPGKKSISITFTCKELGSMNVSEKVTVE